MFHGRLLREASEAKEITMGRISTRRLFVFLTTFLCVVAANVRDVKGRQDFTWKLFNDLNIKVGTTPLRAMLPLTRWDGSWASRSCSSTSRSMTVP